MTKNNGLGKVVEKNQIILQDTIEGGNMTAVRHANGRDWLIVVPEILSDKYYVLLLDPNGFRVLNQQTIGEKTKYIYSGCQSVFTPDGSKFIRHTVDNDVDNDVMIFDFDRCSGLLSNFRKVVLHDSTGAFQGGAAVSPNSRFLYASNITDMYQIDLQAPDPNAALTWLGTWDGFTSPSHTAPWQGQLAPDGRIYFSAYGTNVLNTIHHPNRAGLACDYRQHDFQVPYYYLSIPHHPNYRLGPLDGSACDTLGLDNRPAARFRHERLNGLAVDFFDLSHGAPTAWLWDFGDGQGSTEPEPSHAYAQTGTFTVCLTVSNANASDVFCKTLDLGTLGIDEVLGDAARVAVAPNPAKPGLLTVLGFSDNAQVRVTNANGNTVSQSFLSGNQLEASGLAPGFYVIRGLEGADLGKQAKFVIVR